MRIPAVLTFVACAFCVLAPAPPSAADASAFAGSPASFAQWIDISRLALSVADAVEVSEPQHESAWGIDGPGVLAKHIRMDATMSLPRGEVALLIDGDVRLSLYVDWTRPPATNLSALRLMATATIEVVNLHCRIQPTLLRAGPCGDYEIPLFRFAADAYGIPLKLALTTRLRGGVDGTFEGTLNGFIQADCGLETPPEGTLPEPSVSFVHWLEIAEGASVDGRVELDLLRLVAGARVPGLTGDLLNASAEASCPFVAARVADEGPELEYGAKATFIMDCAPVLEMLGLRDQRRETLLVEVKRFSTATPAEAQ